MREILNFISQRTYIINNKKKARMIFMPYEIYLPINNYQGHDYTGKYEVSNLGNVRNMKTKKVLKPRKHVTNSGYEAYTVNLYDTNNKQRNETIARLVITTFKANSDNKPQVGHLNDDSSDNRLNNLYYTTAAENNIHNGRHLKVAETNKINGNYDKISISVYCITNKTIYKSSHEAARILNLDNSCITKCCKNKRKTVGGYKFEYYKGDVE